MHLTNWREFLKFLRPATEPRSRVRKVRRGLRTGPPAIETLELRVLPTNTVVKSILAAIPPQSTETNATTVTFAVNFDRDVVGVDASDFRIVSNGSVKSNSTISVIPINDATYSVRINGLSGVGDLRLDLIDDDSIQDKNLAGNPLPPNEIPLGGTGTNNGSFQGDAYHLLPTFPQVVSINRNIPPGDTQFNTSISFDVIFSKPVVGVDASDFVPALSGGINFTDPIDVTGSGTTYTVTISGLTGDGSLQLNLVDNNSIRDLTGNPLTNQFHDIAVAPIQTVNTGGTANAVAVGDLNSDGLVDIVSVDSSAGILAVELGNADGTFQNPKTTIITPLSSFPRSLVVRDMDGDGKPDVVLIGHDSNTVSVFSGLGNGSFQSPFTLGTGTGPFSVAVDNLDSNGKPDIVFTNEISNTVGVLKNNELAIEPDADLSGVQGPSGVAIGDLNRDGFLDLAVANKTSNSVTIFLSQNGDGFHPGVSFNVGAVPVAVALTDLNGDGNLDVITANKGSDDITVLLGNGNGSFQLPSTFDVGHTPSALAVTDFNGDGALDVIVANESDGTLAFLLNDGAGGFLFPPGFEVTVSLLSGVVIADVDRDGRPDIVAASDTSGAGVLLVKNATRGDFSGDSYTRVNDFPAFTSPDFANIPENISTSTVVLQVQATDASIPAQTLTYSISGPDAGLFNIDPATGIITFKQSPDYEAPLDQNGDNIYEVISHADDGFGAVSNQELTITVLPVNDNLPVFSSPNAKTIPESIGLGSQVLTVVATDADLPAQNLAYSLSSPLGIDASFFSINPVTGLITVANTLDADSPGDLNGDNIYDVVVTANDGSGGTKTQNIAITVGAVNDNTPIINTANTASVPENTLASTIILDVNATDADVPVQTITYTLSGDDAARFSINNSNGQIRFLSSPDFEAPADLDHDNVYKISVTPNDGLIDGTTQDITISVLPVNDNTPVIGSSNAANVFENTSANSVVLDVNATDADLPAQALTYSLSGGDSGLFSINSGTGEIRFLAPPDFETPLDQNGDNLYQFLVTVSDGLGRSQNQNITLAVQPLNESVPVITSSPTASINENSPASTVILDVNATDADLPAQTLSYSLTGPDAALFSIDSSKGEIRLLISPDFESAADQNHDNIYDLTVNVSDGNGGVQTQILSITVLPLDDHLPLITSSNTASVNENTLTTTVVLDVDATDADLPVQVLTYDITGPDANLFSIDANTGAIRFLTSPDFEVPLDQDGNNVYEITVLAIQPDLQSSSQNVTITVQPLNDNLPVITSSSTANFAENTSASTVVLDVNASDADLPLQSLTYILSGADAAQFSIDSSTGEIHFLAPPDFEAPADLDQNNVYQLSVLVSDGNGGSQSQTIAVTVLPENDNRPAFNPPIAVNFAENTPASSIVLAVSATDADLPAQSLIYSLSGADAARFSLSNLGELRFRSSPDFEAATDQNGDNLYEITVTVTDNGTPNLATSRNLTITVTDANEPPLAIDGTLLTHVNTAISDQLNGSDPDAGASLNFTILTLPLHGILNLTNSLTGAYTYTPDTNYIGSDNFTFQVDDGSFNSPGATVLITVNPTNSPPVAADATLSISENLPNGTVVGTVTATDPDVIPGPTTDVLTYGIASGNLNGAFSIDPSNGELRVANSSVLNFEVLQQIVLQVTVTDIAGASSVATITVNVTNVNEPLIITLPDSPPVYRKNGTPEAIDPEASVYDEDLTTTDYRGGLLVVTVTSSGTPDDNDRLGILVEGTGDGKISLVSQYIVYGSPLNIIGTIASGLDGGPLVINLTSFANQESIGALLQAITFYNTSGKPQSGTRTIHFNLTDGPAENSGIKTKQVEFITDSDPPVVTLPSG
ncbi:MAG: Serralysin, partial [Planctomycetaceae bacterium]|nr:Serralysin [Planctomycetaceae bacterium]